LAHRLPADVLLLAQLAQRLPVALAQPVEDAPPVLVGESVERGLAHRTAHLPRPSGRASRITATTHTPDAHSPPSAPRLPPISSRACRDSGNSAPGPWPLCHISCVAADAPDHASPPRA